MLIEPQDGNWYVVVTCEECESTIVLFRDLTEGNGSDLTGLVRYSAQAGKPWVRAWDQRTRDDRFRFLGLPEISLNPGQKGPQQCSSSPKMGIGMLSLLARSANQRSSFSAI